MLNEQTEEKLKSMRLGGMLEAWSAQRTTPNAEELGFDERFGLLVDAEEAHRENKRLKRALMKQSSRSAKPASRASTTHQNVPSTKRSFDSWQAVAGSAMPSTSA